LWTPSEQRNNRSDCWSQIGLRNMPALLLHLWCSGRHSWIPCKRNPGRSQHHHFINDLIWRALSKAGLPSTKDPNDLLRSDNKRPDGLIVSFHGVMVAALPGTSVTDTVAPSYLSLSSACELCSLSSWIGGQTQKREIYWNCMHHPFFAIAFETFGPINQVGADFISALGHRISTHSDDPQETFFLFQRLPGKIQGFNAVCFTNSFGNIEVEVRRSQPRHT